MRLLFFCLFGLCFFTVFAQREDAAFIKSIYDNALLKGKAYDNLYRICKKIGPRLSGSVNAGKAVETTAGMLRQAGADTVYLQPCMVTHWQRGGKEQGYIQLPEGVKRNLKLCALGNSVATDSKGLMAEVIEVSSLEEIDRLGHSVINGKIIFINIPFNQSTIRTYSAYNESFKGRAYGPSRAAKYGAVAVLVRSIGSRDDDFPHSGVTIYNDSFPKIPAAAISTNDANWLSNSLKKKMQLKAYIRFNPKNLPDTLSYNVIGEIKGSEFPEEIITVGAHLDSWDLGEAAHDNGAGVVQCIESIRILTSLNIHPKRTIRVVLFMDEEFGGKGSAEYFKVAIERKEKHIFALESDRGGFSPRGFTLDMTELQKQKVLQWKPLFYPYGVYDFDTPGGGADITPLKKMGAGLAALQPDGQRYYDVHHAGSDVFETVNKRELELGSASMAAFAWLVSEYGL